VAGTRPQRRGLTVTRHGLTVTQHAVDLFTERLINRCCKSAMHSQVRCWLRRFATIN